MHACFLQSNNQSKHTNQVLLVNLIHANSIIRLLLITCMYLPHLSTIISHMHQPYISYKYIRTHFSPYLYSNVLLNKYQYSHSDINSFAPFAPTNMLLPNPSNLRRSFLLQVGPYQVWTCMQLFTSGQYLYTCSQISWPSSHYYLFVYLFLEFCIYYNTMRLFLEVEKRMHAWQRYV